MLLGFRVLCRSLWVWWCGKGFAAMVSVGPVDFHGVWNYEGRLPHGGRVTRGSRLLSAGWLKFLDLFGFRGFRVLLRG